MTLDDISDLLGLCARYDGRHLDDDTPKAWLLLLEDIPAEDAAAAVREFYRSNPEGWFRPGHIVAYHEKAAAARAVEEARQHPPSCGCGVAFVLSDRPGSVWALPAGPHAEGCRWAGQGVLKFSRERVAHDGSVVTGTWGVMTMDPATFDEVRWEAEHAALAAAAEQGGLAGALNPGGATTNWAERLAVTADGEDGGESAD